LSSDVVPTVMKVGYSMPPVPIAVSADGQRPVR
jgi:hypothetical protein